MSKITTLDHLKTSLQASKTYIDQQDAVLSTKLSEVVATVEGLVASGGEANILEGVRVNGQTLAIADKMVDILIEAGAENGTISVNGAAIAIAGLKKLAFLDEISEDELSDALKTSIAAKATNADLEALAVRVGSIETAGYQTAEQVSAAIQTAISESGHAHFKEVDAVPAAEEAEANVLYLVMNEETRHYDIYALMGEDVVLLDDTTVDLSGYSTTEAMQAYVTQQIAALNIGQYATDEELAAAVERITAVEGKFASYYTREEIDARLEGYATDEEARAAAAAAIAANTATDEEVSAMVGEVFTTGA